MMNAMTVLAILMHDLGHGPVFTSLESVLVDKVHHEHISMLQTKVHESIEARRSPRGRAPKESPMPCMT